MLALDLRTITVPSDTTGIYELAVTHSEGVPPREPPLEPYPRPGVEA